MPGYVCQIFKKNINKRKKSKKNKHKNEEKTNQKTKTKTKTKQNEKLKIKSNKNEATSILKCDIYFRYRTTASLMFYYVTARHSCVASFCHMAFHHLLHSRSSNGTRTVINHFCPPTLIPNLFYDVKILYFLNSSLSDM